MSERNNVVFVRCSLGRGGFPDERTFQFKGFAGHSTCDKNYCFASDRKTFATDLPCEGFVLGIVRGRMPDGAARVECPDGEIYHLRDEEFVPSGEQG